MTDAPTRRIRVPMWLAVVAVAAGPSVRAEPLPSTAESVEVAPGVEDALFSRGGASGGIWGTPSASRGPIIPEPMVFDLVRPLGARRGELEVNALGLVPLKRDRGTPAIEWAPEVEYALRDNFAVEFELPFGDGRLEAYKFAAQYTFGPAFDNQFIHGTQGIVLYDRDRRGTVLSLLYIAGVRFDPKTSMLGMAGVRTEFAPNTFGRRTGFLVDPLEGFPEATTIGEQGGNRTETLFNLTLFHELSETLTLGFEANFARGLEGEGSVLLMPQVQWEFRPDWEIQFGVGSQHISESSIGLAAFRLIRAF